MRGIRWLVGIATGMLIGVGGIAVAGGGPGMGGGRGMGGSPPSFSDFDLNGDGGIDEQEFIDVRTKRIAERVKEGRKMRGLITAPSFSDLDSDGDGSLTREVFDTGMRNHGQRMHGDAPGGVEP